MALVGREVGQVDVVVRGVQGSGGRGDLIPGRGDGDVVLVEELLVAHLDHRAGVLRIGVDAIALGDLRPGPRDELILHVIGAEVDEVQSGRRGR